MKWFEKRLKMFFCTCLLLLVVGRYRNIYFFITITCPERINPIRYVIYFRCDNVTKLQEKLHYLRSLLDDQATFKNIYRYAFDFARVSIVRNIQPFMTDNTSVCDWIFYYVDDITVHTVETFQQNVLISGCFSISRKHNYNSK